MVTTDRDLGELRKELKVVQGEMESAWSDYSRLNYEWLLRCISVVNRAEQTIGRLSPLLESLRELNDHTNPLLDVDPMDLHRARVKAQKLIGQCGEPE